MVNVMLNIKVLIIVNAYTLHVECELCQQKKFWQNLNKVMQEISRIKTVIGSNMNRHMDSERTDNYRVHRGYILGKIN